MNYQELKERFSYDLEKLKKALYDCMRDTFGQEGLELYIALINHDWKIPKRGDTITSQARFDDWKRILRLIKRCKKSQDIWYMVDETQRAFIP